MYDDDHGATEAVSIDPRVTLMQQIADMEQVRNNLEQDGEKIAKKSAELSARINQARNELAQRMGWDSGNEPVAAMSGEEAKKLARERLEDYYGGSR